MRRLVTAILLLVGGTALALASYRSGRWQFNRPDPLRHPITGIDVSHHQGEIDWTDVAASGAKFAFIKATEGRDWVDRRFEQNWRSARAAGLAVGAYHFYTFCSPGAEQAEHFLRTAPPEPDSLPPVADVEFVGNCESWSDEAAVREELAEFLERIDRAWQRRAILYVTPDALERIVADRFGAHPVWIRSVFSEPPLDAYRRWRIWQFSDNSRLPGIRGPVDRNALRPGIGLEDLDVPVAR